MSCVCQHTSGPSIIAELKLQRASESSMRVDKSKVCEYGYVVCRLRKHHHTSVVLHCILLWQAAMSISHGIGRHRIELLIGDHILPYSMTVYEAVKQFSRSSRDHDGGTDTDTDSEMLFGSASIWINTHTIWSVSTLPSLRALSSRL